MFNIQEFKNAVVAGSKLIMLVDDVDENGIFGFVDSINKVEYNLRLLGRLIDKSRIEKDLMDTTGVLIYVLPIGRFIVMLEISKDKKTKRMMFFDYRIDYKGIDSTIGSHYSKSLINQFKSIKYQMEEHDDEWADVVEIDQHFEPAD